jgi:plasmid segregation protein ParM
MIIAVDHGNRNIKLPEGRVFTSGLRESDAPPPFGDDILKYKGKYYTISDKRIPYLREKFVDERFYILTLFAIAFEIEDRGRYENGVIQVKLLAGLPPSHYGAQYERFEKYFVRGEIEEFEFHGKKFQININEATAYPQAFAAAMPLYGSISGFQRVIILDLGAYTADYVLIKNGQPDLSVCESLENGVIILYNQIISRINSDFDILLDESDIDTIIYDKPNEYSGEIKQIVNDTAQMFISDLFGKLRERAIDLRSGKTVLVGGGSILLRKQIEKSGKVSSPIFVDRISANAKGYDMLYKASKVRR